MALGVLMPLVAGGLLLSWWRGWLPARSWLIAVLLQGVLLGSGAVAMNTGEDEEERVEQVVAEHLIEAHEEAALEGRTLGDLDEVIDQDVDFGPLAERVFGRLGSTPVFMPRVGAPPRTVRVPGPRRRRGGPKTRLAFDGPGQRVLLLPAAPRPARP